MTPQMQQEMQQMQMQQRQQQMPPPRLSFPPEDFTRERCRTLKQPEADALARHFREELKINVEGCHGKQVRRAKRTLPMVREDLERKWPEDRASVTVLVPR